MDDVGKVKGFERILNSLLVKGNVDVYAAISSGEALEAGLTTRSVGRDVVKEVLPLSFAEYRSFFGEGTRRELFERYAAIGGFPRSASMDGDEAKIYVKRIYRDVLEGEVLKRNSYSGLEVAEDILRILARDLGKATSAKKVTDCLSEEGSHVSYNTASGYIDALRNCRLIREIPRWDTERKILMQTGVKYYFTDPGLYALFCDERDGALLENIVCLELERRGCRVAACKSKGAQATFLATWGEMRRYVSVVPSLDGGALEKAVDSLLDIRDNYPKYIVTMDEWFKKDHEGIVTVNALDFLSGLEM